MLERTAELEQMVAPYPAGIVAQVQAVGVPHARARILRIDVQRNHGIDGVAARNQSGRRYRRELWKGRQGGPLPPVSQPAKVEVIGEIGCDIGGGARAQKPEPAVDRLT